MISGVSISSDYIKEVGLKNNFGEHNLAVICKGKSEKIYLSSDQRNVLFLDRQNLKNVPSDKLNFDPRAIWTPPYGLDTYDKLFTPRQLTALCCLSDLVSEVQAKITNDIQNLNENSTYTEYIKAIKVYLSFCVDRCADYWSALGRWQSKNQQLSNTFGRQAIPMTWDYPEANPFSRSGGSIDNLFAWTIQSISKLGFGKGYATQASAMSVNLGLPAIISTDPPYYDNIGYADLSDFFYVWLKRSLSADQLNFFNTMLVPKDEELIAAPYRKGGKEKAELFFLDGMKNVISRFSQSSSPNFPISIYYAFKQSELKKGELISTGWVTFLEAIISSGFSIISTWPIRMEMAQRSIGIGQNALATSVILVCRKREFGSSTGTRKDFIQKLKIDLPKALNELLQGNIAPVDLPQSSIGPGISIFSNYNKVIEADGSIMSVTTALQLINKEVDEFLSDQEATMDSWTRFAVTWFSQNKFDEGVYGEAQNLATARNVTVDGVEESGILQSGGGKVRLLSRSELDPEWDPKTDDRLTVWEVTHYLIRELLDEAGGGEKGAATLLRKVGGLAEDAKGLAYRLYTICEQNKWAELGRDYNMLVTLWPELVKQSQELESEKSTQSELEI